MAMAMAMAGDEALEIFREIQALVSDKLQVVSYKWLSRNFSVSSNYAKRLLKEFADKHGNELEVVYTLSGWLKHNPETYCIKLASGLNLAEVKQEFKDNCSVQVYSVQGCIPKDLALLWNAEFVQAEELFSQPSTTENCLRDNRFCGVSNSFVKCAVDGKPTTASELKNDAGTSVRPPTSSILKSPYVPAAQPGPKAQSSLKNGMQSTSMVNSSAKNDRTASVVNDQTSKPQVVKESITVTHANKNKGKDETSSGGGSSLASLWGRTTAKSKPSDPAVDTSSNVPKAAVTAEAQICAHEAADAMSSGDDEADLNYKRELNGASNRKRRVVIDFSDEDEEEENAVNLSSPGPLNVQPGSDSLHDTRNLMEKNNLIEEQKNDKVEVKQDKSKERNFGLPGVDTRVGNKNNITGISLQKKTHSDNPKDVDDGDNKANDKMATASTSPKRRKMLKTRIDERDREVTKVVWEGEAGDSITDKTTTKSDVGTRPPVANKAQAVGRNAPANPVNKAGSKKPAKGGGKDAKQGNILSFFKKV